MFFVAAFSMLAKLAKADGRVSKEEIDSIEKFMLYDLNLDPQGRQVAMNIFQTAVQSPETFEFRMCFNQKSQPLSFHYKFLCS